MTKASNGENHSVAHATVVGDRSGNDSQDTMGNAQAPLRVDSQAQPSGPSDERFQYQHSATIMMVDDEPINMEVVQAFLEDAGYKKFLTTDQSTTALPLLLQERPDVVLLDLRMPGVSGFDILAAMREKQELKHIPAIVLTSSTDAATKLQALELGATDFLAKPVDPSELALRLRNTLSAKAYRDQLAYYDGLTGLPNRRMFVKRLDSTLRQAKCDVQAVAVLHITFDGLKRLYETLGFRAGDAILSASARRLESSVRQSAAVSRWPDEVSRLGDDEFAFCLRGIAQVDNAALVARRILIAMKKPLQIDGHEVLLQPNIGIAVFPHDSEDTQALLGHAISASLHARQSGGGVYQFYAKEINEKFVERLRMESDLRKALGNNELVLRYQPKVDIGTGAVTGTEALVRWNHPNRGLISPDRFIPIAEDTGLIVPIGDWVLNQACKQTKAWHDSGFSDLCVAVNLSGKQFNDPELVKKIQAALEASSLDPRRLTLELTETVIMENASESINALHRIKALGVKLSIDDFGTGYSSLSYLKRFPLDELKIDRSFVQDLSNNADDVAIIDAVIAVARSLRLSTVAEGVETKEQLAFLKQRDCQQYQGYFFSKPLTAAEVSARFQRIFQSRRSLFGQPLAEDQERLV